MVETGQPTSDDLGGAAGARRRMSAVTIDNVIFSVSSLIVFIWSAHLLDPAGHDIPAKTRQGQRPVLVARDGNEAGSTCGVNPPFDRPWILTCQQSGG